MASSYLSQQVPCVILPVPFGIPKVKTHNSDEINKNNKKKKSIVLVFSVHSAKQNIINSAPSSLISTLKSIIHYNSQQSRHENDQF